MPEFHSLEQVADLLNLHVRTVRSYVRDGRLKATRIGKQYRVASQDLETFTGRPDTSHRPDPVRRQRHVEVSSIVEIDAIDAAAVGRIATGLSAAAQGRDRTDGALRIDTIHDEERARLKVIVTGGLATTAHLLKLLDVYLER